MPGLEIGDFSQVAGVYRRDCRPLEPSVVDSRGRMVRAVAQFRADKTRELAEKIDADRASGELASTTDAAGLAGYAMTVLNGLAQRARDGIGRDELEPIAAIAASNLPEPAK